MVPGFIERTGRGTVVAAGMAGNAGFSGGFFNLVGCAGGIRTRSGALTFCGSLRVDAVGLFYEDRCMMDSKVNTPAAGASDLEVCVNWELRAQFLTLADELKQKGLGWFEIQLALENLIRVKKIQTNSSFTAFSLVQELKEQARQAEREAAEAARKRAKEAPDPQDLVVYTLAETTESKISWLWPGKIPLGRVSVVYGEMGIGKTSLALELAARVSSGKNWPNGEQGPEAGHVLILNSVDPLDEVISPRLISAGADRQKIMVVRGVKVKSEVKADVKAVDAEAEAEAEEEGSTEERRFELERDIAALRKWIEVLADVRLVIIDPLEAYCGKRGLSAARMRSVIADLEEFAAEFGVAVVVISSATKCDLPVKNVWRIDCDFLDPDLRSWVPVRWNYGPLSSALAYRITEKGVVWAPTSEVPPIESLQGLSPKQEKRRQLKAQAEWLRHYLLDGPVPAKQILAAGNVAGWSSSQVKRAKQSLQLKCYKERKERGRWVWDLPPQRSTKPVVGNVHIMGALPAEIGNPSEWFKSMEKLLREQGQEIPGRGTSGEVKGEG